MKNQEQKILQEQLWDAAARGDCRKIRILSVAGVDFDARNEDGFTPFNVATQYGHSDAAMTILAARELQYLQEMGVDPSDYFNEKGAPRHEDRSAA